MGYDEGPGGTDIVTSIKSAALADNEIGTVFISTPYPYSTSTTFSDEGAEGTQTYT